jgi:hypothetical protein
MLNLSGIGQHVNLGASSDGCHHIDTALIKHMRSQMKAKRIIIYPKDVQRITGKSERYSRMLLKQIKCKLSKEDHQFVTIYEFCDYSGIELIVLETYLQD